LHGGQIIADWPGLRSSDLFERRDLYPTTDTRSLFKSVLVEHLQIDAGFVERDVFVDSAAATPLVGLFRS
ncbi:MAG: hypothetical protein OET44_14580, partial [Gammaproteobacteria bacterium]|nr:hypothetical protein [Gammaproteobacteria bacterium]